MVDSQPQPHLPIRTGAPHFHKRTTAAQAGESASLTGAKFTLARVKNPSQRNAFKSVRGSNHRVGEDWDPVRTAGSSAGSTLALNAPIGSGREARQESSIANFSFQVSGKAACVAPAAQQEASRTGAKENR